MSEIRHRARTAGGLDAVLPPHLSWEGAFEDRKAEGHSGRERRRTEQWKTEVDSWPKNALGPFPPEGSCMAHDCRTLIRKPG